MSEQITNPLDPFFEKIREIVREEIKAALNGNGHVRESTELLKLKDAAKRLNQSESWV
jgi:hypothetical protein